MNGSRPRIMLHASTTVGRPTVVPRCRCIYLTECKVIGCPVLSHQSQLGQVFETAEGEPERVSRGANVKQTRL
ncbi:hypothetical protein PBY51_005563 [Eleginops maclovinus]|uniref:Uncharacterized protein n=1 Tax=Eleginops maclovinus TaxID=56733 RepID=A0AAN8AHP9_ELEMC|nr:hypothetical protein PBY51_005563 [Eleginops maclovinus]